MARYPLPSPPRRSGGNAAAAQLPPPPFPTHDSMNGAGGFKQASCLYLPGFAVGCAASLAPNPPHLKTHPTQPAPPRTRQAAAQAAATPRKSMAEVAAAMQHTALEASTLSDACEACEQGIQDLLLSHKVRRLVLASFHTQMGQPDLASRWTQDLPAGTKVGGRTPTAASPSTRCSQHAGGSEKDARGACTAALAGRMAAAGCSKCRPPEASKRAAESKSRPAQLSSTQPCSAQLSSARSSSAEASSKRAA